MSELKTTLSKDSLLPILKEYGSYSTKYRHLIWTVLLNLPSNKIEFSQLLKKGLHPCVLNYDQEFPLKDTNILRNLKKISSCLIFWCKVLAECDFLPKFVFPFLKIFPNNSILTFELIATILYNHCQLWFEFSPMEPLNYLGLIENALYHFDPELYNFFKNKNITSKQYAWSLLTSCFSEVLDEQQWYQLWDNILTKELDFLIFVVLAFHFTQRNIIMKFETTESIELFFHEQYIVDMTRLLKIANELMEKCPLELHPRRYLKSFIAFPKNHYPKFENYPKEWIELKNKEMDAIQIENKVLDGKLRILEIEEMQLAKRLENGLKDEEIQRRLKELEKLYCTAISREEERIAYQRKMVLMYQKETRNHKRKVLEMVLDSTNRKNINVHENKLDTLMRNIERTRLRDETDMMLADEDLKDRELNLISQIYAVKSNSIIDYNITDQANKNFEGNNVQNIKNKRNSKQYFNANEAETITQPQFVFNQNSNDRLAKEIEKRNNVIKKTYGIELNSGSRSTKVFDKGQKSSKTLNRSKTVKNVESALELLEKEFQKISNL